MPGPTDPKDHPSSNLENLATFALGNQTFRILACKRQDFKNVVDAELMKPGNKPFHQLSPDEQAFVHGWMYCAEMEYLDENGQPDDVQLRKAIERTIAEHKDPDKFHAMSG